MKRRKFIKLSAISAAGLVLPVQLEGQADAKPLLKPGIFLTPNADFYVLQIGNPAELDANTWRMAVSGLIEKPMSLLQLKDIKAMESVAVTRTLKCIGDPIGTDR